MDGMTAETATSIPCQTTQSAHMDNHAVVNIVTVEGAMHESGMEEGNNTANGNLVNESMDLDKSSNSSSASDKAMNSTVNHIIQVSKRNRIREKVIFVLSLSSLILMAYAVVVLQWLLPYYYAISAPLLIGLRIGLYIKYKWQYFLIDFCYFGNTMLYIFMWAAPWQPEYFMVMFGLAHGPLAFATVIFRNSLVFHNADKMTSVYIHVLPLFLTYGIRWYPGIISKHWYCQFVSVFSEDVAHMFIWLVGVSFASFMCHSFLYLIIVYVICRPDKSYLNSYRYLSSRDGWIYAMLNVFGQKRRFLMYTLFNCFYCIASLLFTIVCYKYFIANSVYLALIVFVVAWNGAAFYIDVFPIKGFGDTV